MGWRSDVFLVGKSWKKHHYDIISGFQINFLIDFDYLICWGVHSSGDGNSPIHPGPEAGLQASLSS